MVSRYTFFDHINVQRVNPIHDWLNSIGGSKQDTVILKAKFLERFNYLEATPPNQWRRPHTWLLEGECSGLYEIRVPYKNVQYRLLAFHGPGQGGGTLAFGAREIGRKFEPRDACQRAQRIKTLVESNPTRYRRVHDFS